MPTSRIDRGRIWRRRWMTTGMVVGRLLGMVRSRAGR
jgi:hypothetical protein